MTTDGTQPPRFLRHPMLHKFARSEFGRRRRPRRGESQGWDEQSNRTIRPRVTHWPLWAWLYGRDSWSLFAPSLAFTLRAGLRPFGTAAAVLVQTSGQLQGARSSLRMSRREWNVARNGHFGRDGTRKGRRPEPRATRGFAQRKRAWILSRPFWLVEAAGIEPASASTPPLALHAYPGPLFNYRLPDGQGRPV